ncbi:agmatinase [Sulfuracidifex metallicus]|uniref:Agmatinase n=1 Tax=Sulfuracidifex metallicus DSM 6482 = JCM 9184 TaxID=523847 RepID=A0A6A9QKT9_SULME|nr:agmatinase [Sulfuracidifex metallicus]MUN28328.1 agmatinase [Sulfuracidifex metallicus DSM 6482 = JCM 9184]WOE51145.1 agmatinase [Sulfuracidifex metallicus DSM 6482 = JCM 9184]
MSDPRLLYLNESSRKFGGFERKDSKFTVVGLPMDITSSYRPGSRFAPAYIREATQYIEFFSLRSNVNVADIGFYDVGDVVMHPSSVEENLKRISEVISYYQSQGKITVSIGGEHTVTTGVIKGVIQYHRKNLCVLSFDAHLDLRDEYMGYKYDHACVMRRISEMGVKVVEVATRAVGKDEIEYASREGIPFITAKEVKLLGHREVARKVSKTLEECSSIYISYDMDGIDPSFAPGVATPEPEGIDPTTVLDIMSLIVDKRIVGYDVVEVSPPYDPSGITVVLGSKLILETTAAAAKATQQ